MPFTSVAGLLAAFGLFVLGTGAGFLFPQPTILMLSSPFNRVWQAVGEPVSQKLLRDFHPRLVFLDLVSSITQKL